jgi:hypothetical protein
MERPPLGGLFFLFSFLIVITGKVDAVCFSIIKNYNFKKLRKSRVCVKFFAMKCLINQHLLLKTIIYSEWLVLKKILIITKNYYGKLYFTNEFNSMTNKKYIISHIIAIFIICTLEKWSNNSIMI